MKLKHYLLASKYNDYKPWIITTPALAVFCLVIWGLRFLMPSLSLAASSIDASDLMSRINAERTQRFIPALITNGKLINAAIGKAQDMMTRSYFAHVDPDGNYVWPRIEAAGYTPYLTLGENLAMDFTSASDMVSAWMNSPTHRENIVNPKFEDQGLATIAGTFEPDHDTIIAVSLFGALYKTPAPPAPPAYASPYTTPVTKARPPYATPYTTPVTTPVPAPAPAPIASLAISKDIKINSTSLSGHTLVNIDVVIAGSPTLVTARLKTQSITLIAGRSQGEFIGSFTFDPTEDLSHQTISVEARNNAGTKITQDFPVDIQSSQAASAATTAIAIPISNEAGIINILRIVFGIFALIYMGFLIVDAVIIRRAKVKRAGIHPNPHILILFLIAVVTLFANWF
ncbi:MAG: CAP domain-containing protein [Candidatus Doudnabacteria bacterium]